MNVTREEHLYIEYNYFLHVYIKTPIATWILARLYDEDNPISRKNLLRNLCQASFDSMSVDTDYSTTLSELEKEELIEFERRQVSDFIPVQQQSGFNPAMTPPETKLKEITKHVEGYSITEKGIIAFRKDIATPVEKIKKLTNKLSSSNQSKFRGILDELKRHTDSITSFAVNKCIENAPYILEFLKDCSNDLLNHGISI